MSLVKTLLQALGHYEEPDYGLTPYPDEAMFGGIRDFQRQNGLRVDGEMYPDGPTFAALTQKAAALGPPTAQRASLLTNSLVAPPKAKTSPEPKNDAQPMDRGEQGEGKVVQAAIPIPLIAGGLAAAVLGGAAAEQMRQRMEATNKQRQATPPLPPVPPSQPEPPQDEKPQEKPIEPPDVRLKGYEAARPSDRYESVLIFPPTEGSLPQIIERRGNAMTKKHLDDIRDDILSQHGDWEQVAGGRDRTSGKDKKEYYIPGPASDWLNDRGKPADGRKGSGYTDMTFKTPEGDYWHIQTVDIDPKTGTPTQRELDNAERIRKRLHKEMDEEKASHQILLIPKRLSP